MTETTATAPTPGEDTPRRPGSRWMLIAAVVAVVAVLAVGIAAFAIGRDDSNSPPTATQQIAAARQACHQWLDRDTSASGGGPGSGWCDDMAEWMSDHMRGSGMMMGTGMWASPQAMRDVCVQAMGTGQGVNGDATQWCDQMVDWMSQHRGNWNDSWNR
jgi:hypothetical protein